MSALHPGQAQLGEFVAYPADAQPGQPLCRDAKSAGRPKGGTLLAVVVIEDRRHVAGREAHPLLARFVETSLLRLPYAKLRPVTPGKEPKCIE